MRRTEALQGLRRMRFEDVYRALATAPAEAGRGLRDPGHERADLSSLAGSVRGRSLNGIARPPARQGLGQRVPVDQIDQVLRLYRERYRGQALP
jgi:hypothetical protein